MSGRKALASQLLSLIALISLLLVLHRASAFLIIDRHPGWFAQSFILGAVLVLTQYFSLPTAVLLDFKKRLMEAQSRALSMAFQELLTGLGKRRYMGTLFERACARPCAIPASACGIGGDGLVAICARLENEENAHDIAQ